jgi:aminopeptidase
MDMTMLSKTYLKRYADILIWGLKASRTKPFRKQDIVLIRYDAQAMPLAEVLYASLLETGLNPVQRITLSPEMEKSFYQLSDRRQIVFQPPGEREFFGAVKGSIYLLAPESITHLNQVDSQKIGKAAVARKYIRDILDQREASGEFSWTLCMLPTEEQARHAELSLDDYTQQIIHACFLDHDNPVSEWQAVYRKSRRIQAWLNRMNVRCFHIESEHIDLEITPGGQRKWVGITGHNIPSFELFMSPDWRGTRGVYFANLPSYRNGNYVNDVRLEFKDGVAVHISAGAGESFVVNQLSTDTGANRLGEFSLTDKRFSKIDRFMAHTLFDENFGGPYGNCHVALGASYADTYNGDPVNLTKNLKKKLGFNDSAIHWDMVNTEPKRVQAYLANGKSLTIYEDGCFTY